MSRDPKIEKRLAALPEPALDDPDNPEWTDEMFAKARPAHEVLPPEVLAQFPKTRGRPKAESPKVPVTLRLDQSVVDGFKATGPGWQTRMNDALAKALEQA